MHILIQKARRATSPKSPLVPEGSTYDAKAGLWSLNGTLLVEFPNDARSTKKQDVETGEDQKGT